MLFTTGASSGVVIIMDGIGGMNVPRNNIKIMTRLINRVALAVILNMPFVRASGILS